MKVHVKVLIQSGRLPQKQSQAAAGFDVYAAQNVVVPARGRALVRLGIAVEFPEGYVALLWDRSGLAVRFGITTIAGVIDADYRGEWQVALLNTTDTDFYVVVGDRVAQVLFQPIACMSFVEVAELPSTQRGLGGFGSTGTR